MDEIDLAADVAALFTEAAVESARHRDQGPLSTGICRSCNEAIEPERLKATPYAKLCASCAAEAEEEALRTRRRGPA